MMWECSEEAVSSLRRSLWTMTIDGSTFLCLPDKEIRFRKISNKKKFRTEFWDPKFFGGRLLCFNWRCGNYTFGFDVTEERRQTTGSTGSTFWKLLVLKRPPTPPKKPQIVSEESNFPGNNNFGMRKFANIGIYAASVTLPLYPLHPN